MSGDKVMGMDTNELDTREEDKVRTEKRYREWEWLQEKQLNDEMELQDMLAEMTTDEIEEWENNPCRKCRHKNNKIKCSECEV
jgi:hypothetical protein